MKVGCSFHDFDGLALGVKFDALACAGDWQGI